MRPLTRVRSGDPLSATQQNRIIDRVNELGRLGNNERGLALFEATADLTYADPLDATAPHCTAKRLYYNTVNRDRQGDYTKAVDTVYMSIADYSGSAYLGTVHIEEGDRFWAVWDSQAGRWEVVMPYDALPPGTTTNDILRWEADESGSSSSGSSSGTGGGRWVIEPAPSDEGEWVLAVAEGVMQWREVKPFTCGDESSGS